MHLLNTSDKYASITILERVQTSDTLVSLYRCHPSSQHSQIERLKRLDRVERRGGVGALHLDVVLVGDETSTDHLLQHGRLSRRVRVLAAAGGGGGDGGGGGRFGAGPTERCRSGGRGSASGGRAITGAQSQATHLYTQSVRDVGDSPIQCIQHAHQSYHVPIPQHLLIRTHTMKNNYVIPI